MGIITTAYSVSSKMKIITLIVFITLFSVTVFAKPTNEWKGIYTFDEESRDEEGTWRSRWFRLVVKEEKGKLQAEYSDGENSKTWKCFLLKVKITENTANFYFERNLDCNSGFKKGDLVLTLKKKQGKKDVFQTIWGKINLGAYSELGGLREDGIFFEKVSQNKRKVW